MIVAGPIDDRAEAERVARSWTAASGRCYAVYQSRVTHQCFVACKTTGKTVQEKTLLARCKEVCPQP